MNGLHIDTYAKGNHLRYAVVKYKRGCVLLRKIPDDEYASYFQSYYDEVLLDSEAGYWLVLKKCKSVEDCKAALYKAGIGVLRRYWVPFAFDGLPCVAVDFSRLVLT